jgi:ribosomal protein S18 acetylase RimI-like enzyme
MRVRDPAIYPQIAAIHIENIDRGFLAQLGERFLALLYCAMDEDANTTLIVEQSQDRVVGFVSGGTGLGPVYRALLLRFPALFGALLPALLSPGKLYRIAEILLHSRSRVATDLPAAELFSIAVIPEARGTGCAERLYRGLCDHFAAAGVPAFRIVAGQGLDPAHAFYRRMGARPKEEVHVHGGALSTVYVQLLDVPSPNEGSVELRGH